MEILLHRSHTTLVRTSPIIMSATAQQQGSARGTRLVTVKVVFLGDSAVGKSSMVLRYVKVMLSDSTRLADHLFRSINL